MTKQELTKEELTNEEKIQLFDLFLEGMEIAFGITFNKQPYASISMYAMVTQEELYTQNMWSCGGSGHYNIVAIKQPIIIKFLELYKDKLFRPH